MRVLRVLIYFIIVFSQSNYVVGQDPAFSQFYASPLNVNPSLTGHTNTNWRLITNIRNQWLGNTSSYTTGTVSFEKKLFSPDQIGDDEQNRFAIGGMMLYDRALYGAIKNNFASLNTSYNIVLRQSNSTHRLGAGVGVIYGDKRVNYNRLTFEDQFTGIDFNSNLPTSEFSLNNMKPYVSISLGVLYSISSENSNLDIGLSTFHINRPKLTFIEDERQYISRRNVLHGNFESYINQNLIFNANAIYQEQAKASYVSGGVGLGYYLQSYEDILINTGLWMWSNKAVIPYVGFSFNNFQVGMSYDVPTQIIKGDLIRRNSFEFSLIIKGERATAGYIPSPWK